MFSTTRWNVGDALRNFQFLFKLHAIPEAETTHLPQLIINMSRTSFFYTDPTNFVFLYEIDFSLLNASYVVKGRDRWLEVRHQPFAVLSAVS